MPEKQLNFSDGCVAAGAQYFDAYCNLAVRRVEETIAQAHGACAVPEPRFIASCLVPEMYLDEGEVLAVRPVLKQGDADCLPVGCGGWHAYAPLFEAALEEIAWPVDLQVIEIGGLVATPAEHASRLVAEAVAIGERFPVVAQQIAARIKEAFPTAPDDQASHEPPLGNGG